MADTKKIVSGSQNVRVNESADDYSLSQPFDESLAWDGVTIDKPAEEAMPARNPGASRSNSGHSNLLIGILAGVGVLIILVILGWQFGLFGGAEPVASVAAAPMAPPAQPSAPPTNPIDPPAAVSTVSVEQQTEESTPKKEPQNVQELRKEEVDESEVKKPEAKETKPEDALPDDVTAWKKEHYYLSRRRNDPKLLEAVSHLGENFRGNALVAQGLADLLKRLPPDALSDSASPESGSLSRKPEDYTRLVGTLVAALGKNGSETARTTLEQILAGSFATDDDTMAVEVALEALAANSCKENEAILLRAVSSPEGLRPIERQGAWAARDLRLRAVDLIKPVASAEFRLKLGELVAGHISKFDLSDPVRVFLLASDPMSCGAQTLIYENPNTLKEVRGQLEEQLTDYSSHTLAFWIGLLDKASEEAAPAAAPTENQPPSALDAIRDRERRVQEDITRERERIKKMQEEANREQSRKTQEAAEREQQARKAQEDAERDRTQKAQVEAGRNRPTAPKIDPSEKIRKMQADREEGVRKAKEQEARDRAAGMRDNDDERIKQESNRIYQEEEAADRVRRREEDTHFLRVAEATRKKEEAEREKKRQQQEALDREQARVAADRRQPGTGQAAAPSSQSPLQGFLFVDPPEKIPMPNLELWLAGQLWSEHFRAAVDSQLDKLASLEKQSQLVLLASTIPFDSTRAALARAFRIHWKDGTSTLEAAGWIDRMTTDPGLLVLVKMNPRKEPRAARTAPTRPAIDMSIEPAPENVGGVRPGSARVAKAAEARKQAEQKKEQEEQARQDWMAVSSKLVFAWCQRLHGMAVIKDKKAAVAGHPLGDSSPKLPDNFDLDPNARVVASYHAVWPDQLPTELSSVKPSPLEIHYIRTEETNKPKRAIDFYVRQTRIKKPEVRTAENSLWMDVLRPSPQNERRKSLDVLISRADNAPLDLDSVKNDEETDLIVEILSIEIKDPDK